MTHHQTPGPVSRRAALAGLGAGGLGLALTAATRPAAAQAGHTRRRGREPARRDVAVEQLPRESGTGQLCDLPRRRHLRRVAAGGRGGNRDLADDRGAHLRPPLHLPRYRPVARGVRAGTATFTIAGELDETGNALTATGTIGVRDPGGVHLVDVPWTRPATRVTFETNPSTGSIPATPVAATPSA